MYSEDAVFVGDYVFWDFDKKVPHIVFFQYGRLRGTEKEGDVQSEIVSLFEKIGLWEEYINIQKTVKEEIAGGLSQAISTFDKPRLFRIEFSTGKITPICAIGYTKEASLRLTKGELSQVDLDIEEVRNRLIGLHKWIVLMRARESLKR